MRSDENDRTTHETDEHERLRRRGYDRWSRKRIIEIGTIIGLLWGGYVALSSAIGARWATHGEVKDAIHPVTVKLDSLVARTDTSDTRTDRRLRELEGQHRALDSTRSTVEWMARLWCLQLERDRSTSLADIAGKSCDPILGRRMR